MLNVRCSSGLTSVAFGDDACGDALGEALTGGGILNCLVFRGVGDEAEFAKDGGAAVGSQDVKSTLLDAAVYSRVGLEGFALDVGGEAFRLDSVVEGLDAVRGLAAGLIVMHANENARGAAVGGF